MTATLAPSPAPAPSAGRTVRDWVATAVRRGAAVWVIVAVLIVVLSVMRGGAFWSTGNIAALLTSAVVLGLVALGQHTVILSGGIDLSVGSMVTITTLLTAVLIDGYPIRTFPVILGMLALGALLGTINGLLVTKLNMPPFIVTLGMLYLVSGAALWISSTPAGQVTSALTEFAFGKLGPIPLSFVVLALAIAIIWFLLNRTVWGKQVFAVGGDLHSARAAGISTNRVLIWVYVTSGLLAAVAGILLAARSSIGSPTAGDGLELSAITVVVIGGTSLLGGRGTLLGTMGGVALLSLITNSITLLQFPSTITDLIRGVIIIAAVAVFVAKRRR
ncbi:ABC transporter permease [Amnibacterium flavum]|uniref:Sugar ABC transporter permease n=1 Tax=Amnibacterium flavum TaxID=2173173 RepID=A0A2V1HVY3_9MICO|nr:ABC transporter permease [Amnibacterium flavum]PVZ94567.1 sugar ABC transporter permease [Amnibacterium flavum]